MSVCSSSFLSSIYPFVWYSVKIIICYVSLSICNFFLPNFFCRELKRFEDYDVSHLVMHFNSEQLPWLSQIICHILKSIIHEFLTICLSRSSVFTLWHFLENACMCSSLSFQFPHPWISQGTMDLPENWTCYGFAQIVDLSFWLYMFQRPIRSYFPPLLIFHFFWNLCRGISWVTKDGVQQANYFGSLTQASTCRVGSFQGEEVYAPFKSLLPMVRFLYFSINFNMWG